MGPLRTPVIAEHESEASDDLIDSRIDIHDSNQFEVKLDYDVDPKRKDNRYHIEVYFFIPRSLGISSYTYSRDQFYGDVQAYIRFKTPSMSLAALLDRTNPLSPLTRITEAVSRIHRDEHDQASRRTLSYELRLLGCLVRANVRDRTAALVGHVKGLRGNTTRTATLDLVKNSTLSLVNDIEAVMSRLRELALALEDPVHPGWLREVYKYVDEYLSLSTETQLTALVHEIDRAGRVREALGECRQRLTTLVLAERQHRQDTGYASVLRNNGAHDHFVYRLGVLKKFVSSVLFLEISKEKEGRKLSEFVAGIAAGIAMLIATGLGIASQQAWGINSLPFVVALVASYILKDRIKDWMKQYFSHKMTHFLADYDVRVRDPETGAVLGRCREAFSFLDKEQVPSEVMARRHRDAHTRIEVDSKPEVIMKYEKDVRLDATVIGERYGRLGDINDIIRFNIADFLVRTDDPIRVLQHYDPNTDEVTAVRAAKVYHLNVVFVLRAEGRDSAHGHASLERVRVIIDKRGIRRLEEA